MLYVSGLGYFYEWDEFVEIDSFSKSNGLGQYDLDGYVSLASIDLIEVAASTLKILVYISTVVH